MKLSGEVLGLVRRRGIVTPKIVSEVLNVNLKQAQNTLYYLLRTRRIRKICWGYYTILKDPKTIGCRLVPSYISFLSALSLWGITTQIPKTYMFATIHRVVQKECYGRLGIYYIRIPRRAFLGYTWRKSSLDNDTYFVAEPEKAIVDMIYVEQDPIRVAVDWSQIDKKKTLIYAKYYSRKIQKKTIEMFSTIKKLQH